MNTPQHFGEYLVTGSRRYRGHNPGTTFQARLDRNAEARAIHRGDITLLRRITPDLPAEITYPAGWDPPPTSAAPPTTRGAERRLSR